MRSRRLSSIFIDIWYKVLAIFLLLVSSGNSFSVFTVNSSVSVISFICDLNKTKFNLF